MRAFCASVIVVFVLCIAGGDASARIINTEQEQVSEKRFGRNWPFTVLHGILECRSIVVWEDKKPLIAVIFIHDGVKYAVNGTATGQTGVRLNLPIRKKQPPQKYDKKFIVSRLKLTEHKRIFHDSLQCERRARDQANLECPLDRIECVCPNSEQFYELFYSCKDALRASESLTEDELIYIEIEGSSEIWPPSTPMLVSIGPMIDHGLDMCR